MENLNKTIGVSSVPVLASVLACASPNYNQPTNNIGSYSYSESESSSSGYSESNDSEQDKASTKDGPEFTPMDANNNINPICCNVTFTLYGRFQTIGPVLCNAPKTSATTIVPPAKPNLKLIPPGNKISTDPKINPIAIPRPKENKLILLAL